MKNTFILLLILSVSSFTALHAQDSPKDSTTTASAKIYVIKTMNGVVFMGPILSQDTKEVVIRTKDRGDVSIPKYEIKEMKELAPGQLNSKGELIFDPMFATRYFITTNAFPIEKGDNYIQTNLWGPEFHFGVSEKFGIGVMTSWLGVPVIGTAKYSFKLSDNLNFALGGLLGTGSWAAPNFYFALPFGALTFGNKKSNLNFSVGHGIVGYSGSSSGSTLVSVGGLKRMSDKVSFILDSFILPTDGSALIIPGLRFQTNETKAFQFGLTAIYSNGSLIPFPIPMLSWFKKL